MKHVFFLGLGDLLVLSSWDCAVPTDIYLHCACPDYVGAGCELLYPGAKIWNSSPGELLGWCGYLPRYSIAKSKYPSAAALPKGELWSVATCFPDLKQYRGSGLLTSRWDYRGPAYKVIVPWSTNGDAARNFTSEDWEATFRILERDKVYGVVLVHGSGVVPAHKRLLNLANKTTLRESIKILTGGKGLISVDSALACLGVQLFSAQDMAIKSVSKNYLKWIHVYCHPHRSYEFVNSSIVA